MTTDAQFGRDALYFGLFVAVALADSLIWRAFTQRHPAEAQRPGDVGQLATVSAAGCLLTAIGLGAVCAVVAAWMAGW